MERGDEFDDLIAAEWGPSRGPLQLINSKDPTKAWEHVRIDDEGQERPTRRLAVGNLDGDGYQDLVEWRLPTQADGKISVHWYRGVGSDRGRTLRYASKLMLADLPPKLAVADARLADIDGDGDDDLIARLATHFGNYWETTLKLEKDMPLEPPSLKWWRNDGVEKPWPGTAINKPGDFAGAPLIVVDDDGMLASHLHVRDLDNDGDPDIATVVLSQKVASQWFENVGGRYEERMTSIQVISDTERAVMPGFDPWLGGMMTRADVNGDGTPDRILAFPGYEPEDFDDDRRWARGVRWERGGGLPR